MKVKSIEERTVEISREDLIALVGKSLGLDVPESASVFVVMPSDWAGDPRPGEEMPVCKAMPVCVRWKGSDG